MHEDIMKNGTPEQKAHLQHLEATRRDRRKRGGSRKKRSLRKKKTRDPNETPEMRTARKKRQLKKRNTRKAAKQQQLMEQANSVDSILQEEKRDAKKEQSKLARQKTQSHDHLEERLKERKSQVIPAGKKE